MNRKRNLDLTNPKDQKIGLLVGIVFVLIGLIASYLLILKPKSKIKQAQNWVQTSCIIKTMEIKIRTKPAGPKGTRTTTEHYVEVLCDDVSRKRSVDGAQNCLFVLDPEKTVPDLCPSLVLRFFPLLPAWPSFLSKDFCAF